MLKLAITGGIACGKSSVARLFAGHGVPRVDTDKLARSAVEPGTEAYQRVVRAFGRGVVGEDGGLDRGRLGELVFADPTGRRRLEGIVHPEVVRLLEVRLAELAPGGHDLVVIEIPLLYEAGLEHLADTVLVVTAPLEVRIERMGRRDGLSREDALARIGAQMPVEEKAARTPHVIDNDGDLEKLATSVERVWREIRTVG